MANDTITQEEGIRSEVHKSLCFLHKAKRFAEKEPLDKSS